MGEYVGVTASPADALLDGLDPEQRAVARAVHGPVVVVAGAGTGKTRAVTHRIAYGVATGAFEPDGVLAVTFTTRAAAEMRARLAALGVTGAVIRTFHSAALSQVRYLWPRVYGRPFPEVVDASDTIVAGLADASGVSASARDVATEIAWAKVSNVPPDRYVERAKAAGRRVAGARPQDVARLYRAYVDALESSDRVDLEDVLLAAAGVLTTQPGAARLVRQRYRWFTVDEFQDVSPLQMRLLECWLGDRDDLCVVGDPRQSIYGFAGARPDLLASLPRRFPRAEMLELTRNYRSTPQVLSVGAAVLAPDGTPGPDVAPLRATRPDGADVLLLEAEDQAAEARDVARRVAGLLADGLPEGEVAVLARTQAHVRLLAQALGRHGVPVAAGGATAFYERPEVRQALALLSAAARRSSVRPTPEDEAEDGPVTLGASVREVFSDAGWVADPRPGDRVDPRWQAWATLVGLADDLERDAADAGQPSPGLGTLMAEVREQQRTGRQPRGTGVTVATLHATKGQQWTAVFIAGAYDGGVPIRSALGSSAPADAQAEERRLLYVGVTRAKDHLVITWPRRASADGPWRRPSRFVAGLLDARPSGVDIHLRSGPAAL